MNPISSFELLFFAVFGQTTTEQTQTDKILNLQIKTQPYWTEYLFKIVFGIYMLVSVVVLINLLIAMMSDTYQRIQVLGVANSIFYTKIIFHKSLETNIFTSSFKLYSYFSLRITFSIPLKQFFDNSTFYFELYIFSKE